jgi:hypothetical protein
MLGKTTKSQLPFSQLPTSPSIFPSSPFWRTHTQFNESLAKTMPFPQCNKIDCYANPLSDSILCYRRMAPSRVDTTHLPTYLPTHLPAYSQHNPHRLCNHAKTKQTRTKQQPRHPPSHRASRSALFPAVTATDA